MGTTIIFPLLWAEGARDWNLLTVNRIDLCTSEGKPHDGDGGIFGGIHGAEEEGTCNEWLEGPKMFCEGNHASIYGIVAKIERRYIGPVPSPLVG